jgi:hypothetical protein
MKPDVGLAQSVLPSLLGLVLLDRVKILLAKACPFDQMALVDLEDAIEAGIEDRGQREPISRRSLFLAGKGQADPDDDLGRTKIDAPRWDFNFHFAKERTA